MHVEAIAPFFCALSAKACDPEFFHPHRPADGLPRPLVRPSFSHDPKRRKRWLSDPADNGSGNP